MQLKNEFEELNNKLKELTKEEMEQVVSGRTIPFPNHDFWDSWNPYFNYEDTKKQNYTLNIKLKELSEYELKQVAGDDWFDILKKIGDRTEKNVEHVLKSSNFVFIEETLIEEVAVITNGNKNC